MAISLAKTLQTVDYTLYIRTRILYVDLEQVVTQETCYQSEGHFADDFLPIIMRGENITNANLIQAALAFYPGNDALATQAIENYLVQSVAWYSGGSVVA